MNMVTVKMVRIYLTEEEGRIDVLLKRLHDWEKVRGVTVYRGITGFGRSGMVHTTKIWDMSLNLPIVVEFFDEPDKIDTILEHLTGFIESEHIVTWTAEMIIGNEGAS